MFKGLTKDLTGTADICNAVTDFTKLHVHTYLLPDGEAGEEILFAFASAKEEFVFTNQALITVCGENATTTRKRIERFDFRDFLVTNVQFETTGRVDRDCEIKFTIGGDKEVSIDIAKKEEDAVKKYYKALVALGRAQEERVRNWKFAQDGLRSASQSLKLRTVEPADANWLAGQASQTLSWLTHDFERLNPRCYKSVIVKALADQATQ